MPHLPAHFAGIILWFARLFVHLSWRHAQALLIGAIFRPGRSTVASVLRITGRARDRQFVNIHRVLSRAEWSPRSAARILLRLPVSTNSRPEADRRESTRPGRSSSPPSRREADHPRVCEGADADSTNR
jgi:hypothetical protein